MTRVSITVQWGDGSTGTIYTHDAYFTRPDRVLKNVRKVLNSEKGATGIKFDE